MECSIFVENIKTNEMIDLNKVTNVEVDGIDFKDYPDFVDSYIFYAELEGVEMTEDQLEELSENTEFVYNAVIKTIL